jgi:chromosome segregation ATPase
METVDELVHLDKLEEVLDRFTVRYAEVRRENAQLKATIQELLEEIEGYKQECNARSRQLEHLKQQRAEIGKRVSKIREHIASLERPMSR